MKTITKSLIASTVALISLGGMTTTNADTAVVAVTASVSGVCKFNSGGTVSFTLDPSVGGLVNGTVTQPQFWCTKGASYSIGDDVGLNETGTTFRMKHATLTEYIPYTFTYTKTGTGNGANNALTLDIASTVAGADYVNASAGSYGDTVTLTITP